MPPKKKQTQHIKHRPTGMRWKPRHAAVAVVLVVAAAYLYWHIAIPVPDLPQPPLKDLAAAKNIELGMLAQPRDLNSKPFSQTLTDQYSKLTSDGQMHWDAFRPSPTIYDFAGIDRLVAFASANNMPVEGHHLVWDEADSLPAWLKSGNYSRQQLLDIMQSHISTVAGRYRGKIAAWTVVNEPFTRAQHVYGLQAWWADRLGGGTDYIDKAFLWARQADPKATLILNDFYNETETPVSNAMYDYLKSAKSRSIPVDAIGMQVHVDAAAPPDKSAMIKNMQRFGALGFPVYITEFDVNSSRVRGSAEYKAQLEARITADVVRACVESKSCVSFTVFGMTDKVGYDKFFTRAGQRSYMLDGRYRPKASFQSFHDAWLQR